MTHDPVPDHGVDYSRIMMSSRLLPSLHCNDVQSEILDNWLMRCISSSVCIIVSAYVFVLFPLFDLSFVASFSTLILLVGSFDL